MSERRVKVDFAALVGSLFTDICGVVSFMLSTATSVTSTLIFLPFPLIFLISIFLASSCLLRELNISSENTAAIFYATVRVPSTLNSRRSKQTA